MKMAFKKDFDIWMGMKFLPKNEQGFMKKYISYS